MNNALLEKLKKVSLFFALTLIIAFVFVNANNVFIKDFRQHESELLSNSLSNETPDPMPTMFPTIDDSKQKNIEPNVKCLGFDRKYSYVTQDVCDMNKKYWSSKFGYFPTDPEEVVECKGADGKISFVKRLVCEETNKFWDTHRPSEVSNNSSDSNNKSVASSTPTPTPTVTPWYLTGGAPTPIAVYQADGAANLAASQVNLVNPGTYNLVTAPGLSIPTWDAINGWDVTGKAWDTGIIPAASYSTIVSYTDQTNSICGLYGSDGRNELPYVDYNVSIYYMPGTFVMTSFVIGDGAGAGSASISNTYNPANGVLGLTPLYGWQDGISVAMPQNTWSGTSIYSMFLGARSHHGTATNTCVGYIQRFAVWDVDVSDYMPALSEAINN